MKKYPSRILVSCLLYFLYFGNIFLAFGSTWELYQVFSSSKANNNGSSNNNIPSTNSKLPLLFTFKPDQKITNLTTGKGRVLFVNDDKKTSGEEIPRFTSDNEIETPTTKEPNKNTENDMVEVEIEKNKNVFNISKGLKSLLSTVMDFVLQFISVDDALNYLSQLKTALINYYGSNYNLIEFGSNSKSNQALSTSRNGGWGGIGFPSLEGALLSLAFLTFAVFLIDLIQNLLANLAVPTTGGTGVTGTTLVGRKYPLGRESRRPLGRGRQARESNWMSDLTTSVISAVEHSLS